jgi:iron(III) transport system substrate-binding protein
MRCDGRTKRFRVLLGLPLVAALAGLGNEKGLNPAFGGEAKNEGTVVVYSSLDREFSDPVLKDLASAAGITLRPKYDVESTKTVGLVNTIIAESVRPRCDLFWNTEILNTIRLKRKGLLQPYHPSHAGEVPATFKDPEGMWYGFAGRARILIVNTKLVPESDGPKGIADLADPKWKGKIGIAKPLFGTTATHAACLFATWGDDKAKAYFRSLKANDLQVFSGNKQVATAVSAGQMAFGLTDTDDAMGEIDAGAPVTIIYPDREAGQLGTLFIPNTLLMLRGAPHPEAAKLLADAIVSPAVEERLADGPSAQIPLLKGSRKPARVETPATVHAMPADFQAAADAWDRTAAFLAREFAD